MGQWETLSSSQIQFITLFSAGAQPCCAFYQPPPHALCKGAEPKPANFDFSSSNLTVQYHILSTAGDALCLYMFTLENFAIKKSSNAWHQGLAYKICSHWEIEGGIFFLLKKCWFFLGWTKPHLMGIQPATSACLWSRCFLFLAKFRQKSKLKNRKKSELKGFQSLKVRVKKGKFSTIISFLYIF